MKIRREVGGQMMEFELTPNEIGLATNIGNQMDMIARIKAWLEDPEKHDEDEEIEEPTEEQIEEIAELLVDPINDAIDNAFDEHIPEKYQWVML